MPTRVLLTVDTELTWGHYARGAGWEENWAKSIEPAGVGISYQLELLREHRLKACFFVDPLPALVYGIEPIRRMVAPILDSGQEVQLHLHPMWLSVAEGRPPAGFELTCFDAAAQDRLIATARDLLVEAGAPEPIAFRSGSYAADIHTLDALCRLGISYDSSHNGSHHPDPSALPLPPAQIAPVALAGVIEVPVTQISCWVRALRHLQICALSSRELRQALLHAGRSRHPVATVVSHSFELATRDGKRANGTVRKRFESLCRFLASHRGTLPTAHFAELDGLPLGTAAEPMRAHPLWIVERLVQQLWSNLRYERRL